MPTGKFEYSAQNVFSVHPVPLVAILRKHSVQRVAPIAAVIATASAHKDSRLADQRAFALNGRPENLANKDVLHVRM